MMEMFDKKNGAHEKVGQPVTFKDKTGHDVTVAGLADQFLGRGHNIFPGRDL